MNRVGRCGSMSLAVRMMCSRWMPVLLISGGTNSPSSRNDLMLLARSSDEADCDSKMMGSGRLRGDLRLSGSDDGCEPGPEGALTPFDGFLTTNCAASFRTWLKSYT